MLNKKIILKSNVPIVNIAVFSKQIDTTDLIKYWLSLNENAVVSPCVYSKLFWIENDPIQINIYKISCDTCQLKSFNKIYHTIVYLSENNNDDIIIDSNNFKPYKGKYTTECVILVGESESEDIIEKIEIIEVTEVTEVIDCADSVENIIEETQQISYHFVEKNNFDQLLQVLNTITKDAYNSAKLETKNNVNLDKSSVKPISKKHYRSKIGCIEDEFYVLDRSDTDGCMIC